MISELITQNMKGAPFTCVVYANIVNILLPLFQRIRQIGGFVTTSECTLFMLMGDSKHPNFKEVQALVKTASPDSGLLSKV